MLYLHLIGQIKIFAVVALIGLTACSDSSVGLIQGMGVKGQWLSAHGDIMKDPQTSALKAWRGGLLTIADASARSEWQKQLIWLDKQSASVKQGFAIELNEMVAQSCFAQYLSAEPDYEGLAIDRQDDGIVYLVTEDASRSGKLTQACKKQYANTGSTDYPTLLVKLHIEGDKAIAVGVRPLQFEAELQAGDSDNDGFEGLAIGKGKTLYLGQEKDKQGNARIFKLSLSDALWQSVEFIQAEDANLLMPKFETGAHPINGMDYVRDAQGNGYLLAFARNDAELWVLDEESEQATKRIPFHFLAPTNTQSANCEPWEVMANASIEGVAVDNDALWLINDPWKRNYMKNLRCESNRQHYQNMQPLLFRLEIEVDWFD